jgi:hypothetical protein
MVSGVWSRPPQGRVTRLSELGDLGDKVSDGAGECMFVCKLASHPGWLYKAYRKTPSAAGVSRIDMLVDFPQLMGPGDRVLVDTYTAWPAARVVDAANQTTGVLLPLAPEKYRLQWTLPTGRVTQKFLDVDLLALSAQEQRQKGLPPQSLEQRISVCASIVAAADLLERHHLVYLDWSYANVFWCPTDHSAYLIDLDGASYGPRPQIQAPQWEDPHVSLGSPAGNDTDRYRVALLIARCLTGARVHVGDARDRLSELRTHSAEVERLVEMLIVTLKASSPSARPAIAAMKAALDAAVHSSPAGRTSPQGSSSTTSTVIPGRGGVKEWIPIERRRAPEAEPSAPAPQVRMPAPVPAPSGASATSGVRTQRGYSGANGAAKPVPRIYQPPSPARPARSPARPSSSVAATVAKVALAIVAIIIIGIIIAYL